MESFDSVRVLLVSRSDYKVFIASTWGLDPELLDKYDVVIDRDTGKTLKVDLNE